MNSDVFLICLAFQAIKLAVIWWSVQKGNER